MRRELFGHRSHVEDSGGGDGYVIVQVGHAIAPFVDDLPILIDAQCAARRIRLVPLRKDFVHLCGASGGRVCTWAREDIRRMPVATTPNRINFIPPPVNP